MIPRFPVSLIPRLICILIPPDEIHNRLEDDLAIQPEGPAVDVVEVEIHPALHVFLGFDLPAESVHLGPTGDAGRDGMAEHVVFHGVHGLEVHGGGVGAWAYDRHIPNEHIPELGELVEVGAAQNPTDAGDAGVVFGGDLVAALLVDLTAFPEHGAELVTGYPVVV